MTLLLHIALGLGVFGLPGYLAARALRPEDDGAERLAVAILAGPLLVGFATVVVAVALGRPIALAGLLAVSGALSLGLAGLVWRGRCSLRLSLDVGDRWLLGLAAAAGLVWLVQYDRDLFQLNCVNNAAALVFGEGRGALRASDYLLAGNRNVRLGNTCLVAPMFIAFGFSGARFLYAWTGALLVLFGALLCRHALPGRRWTALAGGALLGLNPWTLGIPILDENNFACLLTAALLAAFARGPRRGLAGVWLGVVFGVLVGVRHIALLMMPALLVAAWRRRLPGRIWAQATAAAALVGALWAYHHHQVFGSVFGFESFEEYREPHRHALLGLELSFRGLLNWPFHDHLVRTPYNAYPSVIMVPLSFVAHFGVLLCGLVPLGLARLRGTGLGPALLLGMALPVLAVMAVIESTMQPNKMGIVLMVLPCLALPMVAGAAALAEAPRRWSRWAAWAITVAALVGGHLAIRGWTAPVDERVYDLEAPVREERLVYLELERARVLRNLWLPDPSRLAEYSTASLGKKLDDLAFDLGARAEVCPADRPVAIDPEAPRTVVAIDLGEPLVGRTSWAAGAERADWVAPAHASKDRFALPDVGWSELSPVVGLAWRPALGRLDVAVEFGDFHWFGDLPPGGEGGQPTILDDPVLRVAVPPGTVIRVTEVVADHFSRYYRWWIRTGDGITVSASPTVVFTN